MAGNGNRHKVTDKTKAEVSALVSFGITQAEIATFLGISVDTLDRRYRLELDTAVTRANATVARALYNKAVKENDLTAQIFWLKTRGRWRERDDPEKDEMRIMLARLVSAERPELDGLRAENEKLKHEISLLRSSSKK